MNRPGVYNAGFYLQYLWQQRQSLSQQAGFDIPQIARVLSTFHITEQQRTYRPLGGEEKQTRQIIEVYLDLLQRGLPTLPSVFVERAILGAAADKGFVEEKDVAGTIQFILPDGGRHTPRKWFSALVRAHIALDPHLVPEDMDPSLFGSQEEWEFFRHTLSTALGSVAQLFEPQRPLSDMLSPSAAQQFIDQRVDFAVVAPGLRLAVEIDGSQHQDPRKQAGDSKRDEELRSNGWSVLRLRSSEIGAQHSVDALLRSIPDNAYLRLAQKNELDDLWDDANGRISLQTVLAPFGIARIQRTLLLALETSALRLEQACWRIAIIERDVRCAVLAMADFVHHLEQFYRLFGINRSLPHIELVCCQTLESSLFDDCLPTQQLMDGRVSMSTVRIDHMHTRTPAEVDILIDVSVLQHCGYSRLSREVIDRHLTAVGAAYEVRSAYDCLDVRRVSTAYPIHYRIDEGHRDTLTFFLQNLFRKRQFLPGQFKIIQRVLQLLPVIGLLPTGAGKSLTYQLSALLEPGTSIVIDPIISLMIDQMDNLRDSLAIDWFDSISSMNTADKRETTAEDMSNGKLKLLFVSPERLQNRSFRTKLSEFSMAYSVPYAVLDEAHCVSEWGHDFRTSYLRLASTIRKYCRRGETAPTVMALTGTASFAVLSDVQREIDVEDDSAQVYPESFDRKELHFRAIEVPSKQKRQELLSILLGPLPDEFGLQWQQLVARNGELTKAGIIFTPHANGTYGASDISAGLYTKLGVPVKHFTGGVDSQSKAQTQREFKNNLFPLLVATKAFGMGIDKPNIRYTVHFNIPPSLEAFYQEAGRAGRDRETAVCWLLFSDDRPEDADRALDPSATWETVSRIADEHGGDVHRLLWLHRGSFRGAKTERNEIVSIYKDFLGSEIKGKPWGKPIDITVPFGGSFGDDRERMHREKALHRLAILGLVQDYTLDYNHHVFEVVAVPQSDEMLIANLQAYVRRYKTREAANQLAEELHKEQGQTVLGKCTSYLLRFVYEEIEKKRRAALRSMVEVARRATAMADINGQDAYIREELVAYLEKSPFTDSLLEISKGLNPRDWLQILHLRDSSQTRLISTVDGVRQLVGGCRRMLESFPEHPGLLFLSSIGRFLLPAVDEELALSEARRSFRELSPLPEQQRQDTVRALLHQYEGLLKNVPNGGYLYTSIARIGLEEQPSRQLARVLLHAVPDQSRRVMYSIILEDVRSLNRKIGE